MRAAARIRDRSNAAGNPVIDAGEVLSRVVAASPEAADWDWELLPGVYGHGLVVMRLESMVAAGVPVAVDIAKLLASLDDENYFFHARFVARDKDVEVTMVDSAFVDIRGPEDLIEKWVAAFGDVQRLADDNA